MQCKLCDMQKMLFMRPVVFVNLLVDWFLLFYIPYTLLAVLRFNDNSRFYFGYFPCNTIDYLWHLSWKKLFPYLLLIADTQKKNRTIFFSHVIIWTWLDAMISHLTQIRQAYTYTYTPSATLALYIIYYYHIGYRLGVWFTLIAKTRGHQLSPMIDIFIHKYIINCLIFLCWLGWFMRWMSVSSYRKQAYLSFH